MSSKMFSEHSDPIPLSGGHAKATDTVGMQEMFNRYARHMPQTSEDVPPTCGRKTIAIIGSTGFLGPYIVASLLRVHTESEIFCLNRSADGKQRTISALHDITDDMSAALPRLQFLVTDITQPSFGLDAVQIALIVSEVDELVFNAWDPNWSKPLEYFEPFLKAVRSTVDLCASAPRQPRITFVSSICAVGNLPLAHAAQPRVPEEVISNNHCAMPHGYGESKCVAEQLLAKAHEVSGLRINIVRAGQIGGPSRSRARTWPRQGWVYSILKASKKLQCFPTHVQPLDWIPVDSFADGIANSTKTSPELETLQVFNMVHPEPASWHVLYDTLSSRFGLSMQTTSLSDWLDRLDTRDLKLHSFLRAMGNGREYNMPFSNERALRVLPPVVPINEDLLAEWLMGWKLGPGDFKAKM
ncbi:NAD(P)-binding protein [Pyrenochaeta sp. DS3sAY3a]|nr:NAD(P)-binding protein [Pyrenochaeta sp. DS3sAY3a]